MSRRKIVAPLLNPSIAKIKKRKTFWIEYTDVVLVLTPAKDQQYKPWEGQLHYVNDIFHFCSEKCNLQKVTPPFLKYYI